MPTLKEKDIICLVAPAGSLKPDDIQQMQKIAESKGYLIEMGKHLFHSYFYGYNYAGTIEERVQDFQWAIDHPKAKAIWCARGGYGGVQLIDLLDWKAIQKKPKWIIGYSDNTVFHQYMSRNKIPSVHGMTFKFLSKEQTESSWESVFNILNKEPLQYEIAPHQHNSLGKIEAPISGGNLSIIYSLLGSNTIDIFDDKILFIEDWQENWYHLDRMLMGLKRAKVFQKIKGLCIGSFTKMDVKEENLNYESPFDTYSYQIISDYFSDLEVPKAFGLKVGHINENNALLLGSKVKLEISEDKVKLTM